MSLIVVTIIFPFLGFILSLIQWRRPYAMNAFWLACCYMGATMIYWPDGTILGQGADSGRAYLEFLASASSNNSLGSIFGSFMKTQDTLDLYKPLMEFFLAKISTNGHFLFFGYAVVLGFFLSRNLWYILENMPSHKEYYYILWLFVFFFEMPIWKIGGARFATAFHMFIYGLFPYVIEGKKNRLLWCALPVFVHFSFLYISAFVLIYAFIPAKIKTRNLFLSFAFVFFVISLFISELDFGGVRETVSSLSPEAYDERIDGYLNEDVLSRNQEANAARNWYVNVEGQIRKWLVNVFLLLIYFPIRKYLSKNSNILNMLALALLIGGFANIASLASGAGRFLHVHIALFVLVFLYIIPQLPNKIKLQSYFKYASLLLLLPVIVGIRSGLEYYSFTLFGNFITVFFLENNTPLIEIIKYIL